MQRDELLNNLRALLHNALRLRFEGGAYAKFAEAQGLADGYMRALEESKVVTRSELLSLVVAERARFVSAPSLSNSDALAAA